MTVPSRASGFAGITLTVGSLNFSALLDGQGPLVLLIHGFPDGPETFRHQLPALAAAGFRAVAVTSRGYEDSSCPADGDFSLPRLAEDVLGWMDALGETRAHLVGHDWGANLAFAAAKAQPDRVASLTLIAVPHPARLGAEIAADRAQMMRSSYILFFQLRWLAEAWVSASDAAFVKRMWRKWSPEWALGVDDIAAVRKRFGRASVAHAALEYYRQALRPPRAEAARITELFGGVQSVRTLGITGTDDGCISAEVFRRSMRPEDFPGGLRVETIVGAGHFAHQERPEVVNALIIPWLAETPAADGGPVAGT